MSNGSGLANAFRKSRKSMLLLRALLAAANELPAQGGIDERESFL